MYGHPGKKLMFMGSEFGQPGEWSHDASLPWHLIDEPAHAGVQRLLRDLNRLYRDTPALHQRDCEADGFEWLVMDDADNSVFAWLRKGDNPADCCVVVVNFTPQVLDHYRIRVPLAGRWTEVLNSDAGVYGGSNVGNSGGVSATVSKTTPELDLVIPPLAALFLVPER
jgi:1,4-alpha-glucan branching enzyme